MLARVEFKFESVPGIPLFLPVQPEPELDLPGVRKRRRSKQRRSRNYVALAVKQSCSSLLKVRVVEHIEDFRSKLHSQSFSGRSPGLEQRRIELLEARLTQRASP
jgi:hypothetical protein